MKKIFFLGFFISCFAFYGQQKINDYKYVVVENKFDFFKKSDQYQTSSLTKFLFNKYGYTAYLNTDKFPKELSSNRCLSTLYASVKNNSTMLTTKISIELRDCENKIVYTSIVGKSKEKEYKKAYHEAIRNAFKDPIIKNYSFTGKLLKTPKVTSNNNITKKIVSKAKNVLYAQATTNGFQLVDTTPKVVFSILKTAQNTVFIIKDKNGILYQKDSNWIAEYYENGVLVKKVYQVKF